MTFTITCTGPGPHQPADGILGTSSVQPRGEVRCGSAACIPAVPIEQANETTVAEQLRNALGTLTTIIDAADPGAGTLTGIQLSNAVRSLNTAVKALARIERRLIRHAVRDFTGSD